jgi:serine/threonine protein kinase
MQGDNFG